MLSKLGVWISEPKHPKSAYPISSAKTTMIFGRRFVCARTVHTVICSRKTQINFIEPILHFIECPLYKTAWDPIPGCLPKSRQLKRHSTRPLHGWCAYGLLPQKNGHSQNSFPVPRRRQ